MSNYRLLIVSRFCDTDQVYDGSYTGKTVVRAIGMCSTVVDFASEKEANAAISSIQEEEEGRSYLQKTQFRRLWKSKK